MAARTLSRSCLHASYPAPTARAFLQLASRRPLPVLDFLTPRVSHDTPHRSIIHSYPKSACRAFTTTTARRETIAIHNPRQDDDGKDMSVEITPRASNRLREIMAQDANPNLALRITVESGGCHGFQYLMSLTTLPPLSGPGSNNGTSSSASVPMPEETSAPALNTSSSDPDAMPSSPSSSPSSPTSSSSNSNSGSQAKEATMDEDDTVFIAMDGSEAKVVMDGPSLELLKGSKIDYTMELIGSQFKIVDNPLATSACGCGTSFDIKA